MDMSQKSWKSLAIRLAWGIRHNNRKRVIETLQFIEQKKGQDELRTPEQPIFYLTDQSHGNLS
jgi:hypothetical protein